MPVCVLRETSRHFLLECPLFIAERTEILQTLQDLSVAPSIHNLSYGLNGYSTDINYEAFKMIHKFIKDFDRFGD